VEKEVWKTKPLSTLSDFSLVLYFSSLIF
jgi:hypothetical protein